LSGAFCRLTDIHDATHLIGMVWFAQLLLVIASQFSIGSDLYDDKDAQCQSAYGKGDFALAEVLCREAYRLAAGDKLRAAYSGTTLGVVLTVCRQA